MDPDPDPSDPKVWVPDPDPDPSDPNFSGPLGPDPYKKNLKFPNFLF